jgi:TRAP-type mannitol/chloroaromatic compound transport system permease small subunit
MFVLRFITRCIDTLNDWVGRSVAWVTLVMVLVVFVDVVMRYAFNTSFVFTQELEWHLFAVVFLLGAGYTLLYDGHVRVDIFYQRFRPSIKAWVNLIGVIFFLIPGCIMVIDTSLQFVANSYNVMEGSPDPGGVPYRFVLKSAIPLGFALMLIQGISLGLKSFMVIVGAEPGEILERGGAHAPKQEDTEESAS